MYSSIPSGEKGKNRYFCLFSLIIAVALTWQHIREGKEEKTHGAGIGVSVMKKKKNQAKIEMTIK